MSNKFSAAGSSADGAPILQSAMVGLGCCCLRRLNGKLRSGEDLGEQAFLGAQACLPAGILPAFLDSRHRKISIVDNRYIFAPSLKLKHPTCETRSQRFPFRILAR
ncbi:MAG: hypothetical protein D6679_14095 [Candidatus Hydrogenedentota bacterium]|nr:MAG: hypothetical protein D6679_14095 [Candidatus Hydrogenedentota bacterium]